MDSELDRTLNVWDEHSCREFEQFLDDFHAAQEADDAEPPCECFYVDVDLVDNRNCPLHWRF